MKIKGKKATQSYNLNPQAIATIKRLAAKNNISASQLVGKLIDDYLKSDKTLTIDVVKEHCSDSPSELENWVSRDSSQLDEQQA